MKNQLNSLKEQDFVKKIIKAHPQVEIFLVGGIVRDTLLNRPSKDYDIVITNVPINTLAKTLKTIGGVNLVGKRFGVFKLKPKKWTGGEIDIALPRTEHVLTGNGAYKDFIVQSDHLLKIEDDLSRRDFTINAMAWDLKNKKLIDPFDGQKDLKSKIIKTVGEPKKRFAEDYSRMLRAIRFACQLDFTIDKKSFSAIKQNIKKIDIEIDGQKIIASEIIAKELNKALIANPVKALELLEKSQALNISMPELLKMKKCPQPKQWHSEGDVWTHTILALKNLNTKSTQKKFGKSFSAELIWALLFHDTGKPETMIKKDRIRFPGHDISSMKIFTTVANRLKLSSAGVDIEKTAKIIKHHMMAGPAVKTMKDTTIEKYFFNPTFPGKDLLTHLYADTSASLRPNGKPDLTDYKALEKRINKISITSKNQKTLPKPLINGNDIIKKYKLLPSRKIGDLLEIAREAQLNKKIKTKNQTLELLKKYL